MSSDFAVTSHICWSGYESDFNVPFILVNNVNGLQNTHH